MKAKQISVSFGKRIYDQEILEYLETKKDSIGISEYIKYLIKKDMDEAKKENRGI